MIWQTCPECGNEFITDEYTNYTDCPDCEHRIKGDEYNGTDWMGA